MDRLSSQFPEFRRKHMKIVDSEPLKSVDGNTVRKSRAPLPLPVYTCLKCHDAGYTRSDVPFGHPNFGKPIKCECTIAHENVAKQQALENMSGIIRYNRYEQASFQSFNKRAVGAKPAYTAALAYAHDPDGWLVLVGSYGCGKTHLAVSIAKVCLEQGRSVFVQTVPDLLDNLRTAFNPSAEESSFNDLFESMKTADVLVLDDYGAENSTPWAVEKLFQILNYRYNTSLSTVITTNNIGLEGIDQRIKSRLRDNSLVNVVEMTDAQDYRPELKRKQTGE